MREALEEIEFSERLGCDTDRVKDAALDEMLNALYKNLDRVTK